MSGGTPILADWLVIPLRDEFLNCRNSSIVSIATRPFVCGDILSSRTKMPHDARDVDKIDDVDRMYSHCKNEHIVN